MNKQSGVLLSMLVLLLGTAAASYKPITKWDIIIINQTLEPVKFKLVNEDPTLKDYEITAAAYTKTTKSIQHGEYLFTYKACNLSFNYKGEKIFFEDADLIDDDFVDPDYFPIPGADFTPDMTVGSLTNDKESDDNDFTITLHPCQGQPIQTKFVIYSHLENEFTIETISLNEEEIAKKDYNLKVSTGTNRFTKMWSGDYLYTYEACDQTFSGQFTIAKTGSTQFVIRSCEYLTLEGYGVLIPQNSNDVNINRQTPQGFTITNRSDKEFDIALVGPVTYLKKLTPGLNKYEIVPGTYNYVCSVDGHRYSGSISVPESGYGHIAVPPLIEKKQLENVVY